MASATTNAARVDITGRSDLPRKRVWGLRLGWVALVAAALAVGWWAGRATLEPPVGPPILTEPITYDVGEGSVSKVQSFTAQAMWPVTPLATNAANGTVTTIDVDDGDTLQAGDVVYTVDLRPVVAVPGSVPAFRDLAPGTRGEDVRQLEEFLVDQGRLEQADDRYDSGTVAAVQAWQRDAGMERSGVVSGKNVLFVPTLPVRVVLDDTLRVGAVIQPGQPAVSALAKDPEIAVILSTQQQDAVPLATTVHVYSAESTWTGSVAESVATPEGDLRLELQGIDGGPICGMGCASVPVDGSARYRTDLVVIPETYGPVVPIAAIKTQPDNTSYVTLADGQDRPVRVVASAEGLAVVDGVSVGEVIRLPLAAKSTESSAATQYAVAEAP